METKEPEYTLVYLGVLKHYKRDDQLADCRKVVKELGLPAIGRRVYEHNEFDDFVKSLRGNEFAVLPTLEVLGGERGRGVSRRFYNNLATVEGKGSIILDAETKTRSDGDSWRALVDRVAGSLINGRPLPSARASDMAKRKNGLIGRWQRKKGTPEYLEAAKIWSNLSISPAEVAIENLPDEKLRGLSKESIQRIFGSRRACGVWVRKQLTGKETP